MFCRVFNTVSAVRNASAKQIRLRNKGIQLIKCQRHTKKLPYWLFMPYILWGEDIMRLKETAQCPHNPYISTFSPYCLPKQQTLHPRLHLRLQQELAIPSLSLAHCYQCALPCSRFCLSRCHQVLQSAPRLPVVWLDSHPSFPSTWSNLFSATCTGLPQWCWAISAGHLN